MLFDSARELVVNWSLTALCYKYLYIGLQTQYALRDMCKRSIEGFHDMVRTSYALRPGRHVGFLRNNKIYFNFVSILFEKIKLTVSERTYIIVPMV